MILIGYDAIITANMPGNGEVYFGYITGKWQTFSHLPSLFPGKQYISITTDASDLGADVLDVENGDATAASSPGWLISAGVSNHAIYCSASMWPEVITALNAARVQTTSNNFAIAAYPGPGPVIIPGAAAHQWATGSYDSWVIDPTWSLLNQPIPVSGGNQMLTDCVGLAPTPSGNGYWAVQANGAIYSHGDATYLGGANVGPNGQPVTLNKPIVGIASHPNQQGYWLAAADGGVFSYGAVNFFGSMGGKPLNQPIVGIDSSPTGNGYWLVASDGGVFTFGDANFEGAGA